jgi:hypothetical protein
MDDKDGVIRIEDIDYLHKAPAPAPTDHKELVIANLLRVGLPDAPYDQPGFLGFDAVIRNVLDVPFDSAGLHVYVPEADIWLQRRPAWIVPMLAEALGVCGLFAG